MLRYIASLKLQAKPDDALAAYLPAIIPAKRLIIARTIIIIP